LKRLRPEQDAFGRVLLDYLTGRERAATVIERDDGYMSAEGAAAYFDGFRRWFPVERQVLRYVRGSVLDVGVGAGRVALELQKRGHEVVGIDVSPLTVRVARRRGVKRAHVLAFEELDASLGRFDTVVMFMNNFGLFGSEAKARRMLRRLHGLTTERGRIVATTSHVQRTKNADHRAYHRRNRARGRLPGQIRFRLHYGHLSTPWFDYLFVSPQEMQRLLLGTGWHVRRFVHHGDDEFYGAVIDREPR
jgi:SAM-dependent methyltransferase